MNRIITKTMAREAADIMKNKAYSQKIQNAKARVDAAIEKVVRKYIPAPVIAVVNEYPDYFYSSISVKISTLIELDGWRRHEADITGNLTFKIPYRSSLDVGNEDYYEVRKLFDKKVKLEDERERFGDQVCGALIALRHEKAVQKELPDALKYLKFPEEKKLPMPNYTGLRYLISKIESKED